MVYFDSDYLHVEYYPVTKVLLSQWYDKCSSLQYRQALIESIRMTKRLGVQYFVTDRRLLPPLPADDLAWTTSIYLRALSGLPLRRFAIVISSDAAGAQLQELLHSRRYPLPFEARAFDDLATAYDWLTIEQKV